MERHAFVKEGRMQVGPGGKYFIFLDGEYQGSQLVNHFWLPEERDYTYATPYP